MKKALSIKPTFLAKRNDYLLRISVMYNADQFHQPYNYRRRVYFQKHFKGRVRTKY